MKTRKLRNLEVSAVGLGCMGMSHGYGELPDRQEMIQFMRDSYESGCTMFDTAEGYGDGHNEELVGEALLPIRHHVQIVTKFGGQGMVDGKIQRKELTPKEIREHCEASLKRLRTDYIDLYLQHRVSKVNTPEIVAEVMGELIKEGKILAWGQSMATEDEIRRANAVTPMSAVQSEYSIIQRLQEKEAIPVCEELGIGFMAFSPLASGFLSGKVKAGTKYEGDDVRRWITLFNEENMNANQPVLDLLNQYAKEKDATAGQISLAWMLHKKPFIVPIPGTRKLSRLQENVGAADVELTDAEFNAIEDALAKIVVHGDRTDEDIANGIVRDLLGNKN